MLKPQSYSDLTFSPTINTHSAGEFVTLQMWKKIMSATAVGLQCNLYPKSTSPLETLGVDQNRISLMAIRHGWGLDTPRIN